MAKSPQIYKVKSVNFRTGTVVVHEGTIERLITEVFPNTLETGAAFAHEKGNHKINTKPKNIKSLVDNLNWSVSNYAANGSPSRYYVLA